MSYTDTRTAEGASAPFLLVEFQMGDTLLYRYTDTEISKIINAQVFDPASFVVEFPGENGQFDQQEMTLEVQGDLTPAIMLINRPPSYVCRVTFWDANLLDTNREARVRFRGRIVSAKWKREGVIELTATPSSTELSLPGTPRLYTRSCPHVLYGSACKANRVPMQISASLSNDNVLRTQGYPTGFIEANAFTRGEISWTDAETGQKAVRTISRCEDNGAGLDIHMVYPPSDVNNFILVMGCSHSETACTEWHSNIGNFGGQPWIPLKSPHNRYTEFY